VDEPAAPQEHLERLKREAAAFLADGRPEEARVRYAEAFRVAPQDLEARNGLVRCTVILGNQALGKQEPQRAVSHFQLALELSELAGLLHDHDLTVEQGDARGVVTAVLQTTESFEDDGERVVGPDVAHDATHEVRA